MNTYATFFVAFGLSAVCSLSKAQTALPSTSASVECQILFFDTYPCASKLSTIPGKELETSLAVAEETTSSVYPYVKKGHNSQAIAEARASYGNLGVYSLANTIGYNASAHVYADSISEYTDIVHAFSENADVGSPISVTFGLTINRDVSVREISTNPATQLSTSSLDASLNVVLLDSNLQGLRTIHSFQALACAPGPCDDSEGKTLVAAQGIDTFEWTYTVNNGDYLRVYGFLWAHSLALYPQGEGIDGSATATVQAYNSAHTFIRVEGSANPLVSLSGTIYATSAVPEPSLFAMMSIGLLLVLGRRTADGRFRLRRLKDKCLIEI